MSPINLNYSWGYDSPIESIFILDSEMGLKYMAQLRKTLKCTCFGSTYTKIGTIQRRLAWPLRKDDTQNREAFHIFCIRSLLLMHQEMR